jgi:hypothetical protein
MNRRVRERANDPDVYYVEASGTYKRTSVMGLFGW